MVLGTSLTHDPGIMQPLIIAKLKMIFQNRGVSMHIKEQNPEEQNDEIRRLLYEIRAKGGLSPGRVDLILLELGKEY
jgi:hypothetical protein